MSEVIRNPKHIPLIQRPDSVTQLSIHEWYGHNNQLETPLYSIALSPAGEGAVVVDGMLPDVLARAAFRILNSVKDFVPEEVMLRLATEELEGF